MSPFSDTTNLASGVSGADIFDHIRSMMYTTVPPLLISLVAYYFIGMQYGRGTLDLSKINAILQALEKNFTISPLLLLIPVITILLAVKKIPPLVVLFIGAFCGIIASFVFQGQFEARVILNSLAGGFRIDSGVAEVDQLLNRGGIASMMGTVTLAILALGYGEILQKLGVLSVILEKISRIILTPGKLVITTLLTCLLTNMLTASQYMAIILPGETLSPAYKKMGVARRVLSRTLEDGGTIFSYLVPWSMAAVYVSGVLELSPLQYGQFAFFCMLCPLFAVFYAVTGFAIFKASGEEARRG
jgi:NhaC family Na+:H+ antiporter